MEIDDFTVMNEAIEAMAEEFNRQYRDEDAKKWPGGVADWERHQRYWLLIKAVQPYFGSMKREIVEEKELIRVADAATTWCSYGEKKQLMMDICRNLLTHFDIRRRGSDV